MIEQNKEEGSAKPKRGMHDFLQDSNAVHNALKILSAIILGAYIILAMTLAIRVPAKLGEILYELTVIVIIVATAMWFSQITFIAMNLIFNEQKQGRGITMIIYLSVIFVLLVLALMNEHVAHLIFESLSDFMSSDKKLNE